LEDFAHENEEISRGLISFALGYVITETWPENSWLSEYNHCDESCDAGDEDCGCHCREDPYEVEDEDVSQGSKLISLCTILELSHFKYLPTTTA